ncbi:hypothetical protein CRYUN_Cryun22dG0047500 [Craigia yunnanensis]
MIHSYVMGIGEAEAFSECLKWESLALEAANLHCHFGKYCKGLRQQQIVLTTWIHCVFIETRNKLEMESVNNKALIEELDKLLELFCYAACLTGGPFDEARMLQNVQACEWLNIALYGLEVPNLDSTYANMRAVWTPPFHFPSFYSFVVRQIIQKASRNPTVWLEAYTDGSQSGNGAESSAVSDAYAKMLTIFISLLLAENSFFAHFMCFKVPELVPPGGVLMIIKVDPMMIWGSWTLMTMTTKLLIISSCAFIICGRLLCCSGMGIQDRTFTLHGAIHLVICDDAAGFVRLLLGDLESRISRLFSQALHLYGNQIL